MIRLIIIVSFFFSTTFSFAQGNSLFQGNWKVIIVDNGVEYNYLTKKSIVHKVFSDSILEQTDSAEVVEMFLAFAKSYEDYHFIFEKDGSYSETRNGIVRVQGKYDVDPKRNILKLTVQRSPGKESKTETEYEFKNDFLEIKITTFDHEKLRIVPDEDNLTFP